MYLSQVRDSHPDSTLVGLHVRRSADYAVYFNVSYSTTLVEPEFFGRAMLTMEKALEEKSGKILKVGKSSEIPHRDFSLRKNIHVYQM